MNPFGKYPRWIVSARTLLAFATLVAWAVPGPAPAAVERLTATVKAVDIRGGTLDLITGVGLALRTKRVQLPTPLKVKGAAPESAAVVLAPGCIVRVECNSTPAGTVASTVELLRAAPRGMNP